MIIGGGVDTRGTESPYTAAVERGLCNAIYVPVGTVLYLSISTRSLRGQHHGEFEVLSLAPRRPVLLLYGCQHVYILLVSRFALDLQCN